MASPFHRENAVYIAKVEEEAEDYDGMAETMEKVAKMVAELTADERKLLSTAYKKKIWSRRASWRILTSNLEKESDEAKADLIRWYRNKVEAEMTDICKDVVLLVDDRLLPSCSVDDPASSVFYYKMKGDFIRYLAEFKVGDEKVLAINEASKAYKGAMAIAKMELPPTDAVQLAVAFNFSVFTYEILGLTDSACEMADEAFNEALLAIDIESFKGEAYKDSREIMLLLRDNLTLWKAEKLGYGDDAPPNA